MYISNIFYIRFYLRSLLIDPVTIIVFIGDALVSHMEIIQHTIDYGLRLGDVAWCPLFLKASAPFPPHFPLIIYLELLPISGADLFEANYLCKWRCLREHSCRFSWSARAHAANAVTIHVVLMTRESVPERIDREGAVSPRWRGATKNPRGLETCSPRNLQHLLLVRSFPSSTETFLGNSCYYMKCFRISSKLLMTSF